MIVRAVIDIGTNSVKLLVARVYPGSDRLDSILERGLQTRLGEGLQRTGRLTAQRIEATAAAAEGFLQEAVGSGVAHDQILVIATQAAREAENTEEFMNAVEARLGIRPRIISGQGEALAAYRGVASLPGMLERTLLVMDIGGGSTELTLGMSGEVLAQETYPLGTVRLLESLSPEDRPSSADWKSCQETIDGLLASGFKRDFASHADALREACLVGTGGATLILARIILETTSYERQVLEGVSLPLEAVRACRSRLWGCSLQRRQKIVGLPPERADVMLMGAAIQERVLEACGFPELRVSTRGVRFGVLLDDSLASP